MLTSLAGYSGGLQKATNSGDALNFPAPTIVAADAAATVDVAKIHGGVVQYSGFTAGRVLTTDTAANIIAAFPELDIGDSFTIAVSCVAAFAGTWAAGAGVTLLGRATTPASSFSLVVITRTGTATVSWNVL